MSYQLDVDLSSYQYNNLLKASAPDTIKLSYRECLVPLCMLATKVKLSVKLLFDFADTSGYSTREVHVEGNTGTLI